MMVMLIEIENEGCFGGHFRETRSGCLLQQPLSIMMMHSDKFSHKKYTDNIHRTMCTLFSIFFRATEQAQTYLKIWVWHPIKHVFVPACSSVRKVHLFTFLWFWNSRYVISPKICPCILPFFPKYAPSSSSSSLGHSRPSASLSTTNIVDLLSTIIVLF